MQDEVNKQNQEREEKKVSASQVAKEAHAKAVASEMKKEVEIQHALVEEKKTQAAEMAKFV